jgi:hypothetical protein
MGIPSQNLHRYVAGIVLGLLSTTALILVARRLAGALANPLEPATLLIVAAMAATTAVAIRLSWLSPPLGDSLPGIDRAVMILTSLAVAGLGAGLCLPGTSAVGMFLLWTLLGAEESWAWGWRIRHGFEPGPSAARPSVRTDLAHAGPTHHSRSSITSRAAPIVDAEDVVLPKNVTQQLTRSQAADGAEELSGWLRIAFVAGQRTGSLHVAFCPPFAATPELAVEQLDGPEARMKTAQLMPYGARLDLKLASAAEQPTTVLLQFSARTVADKEN